MHNWLDDVTVKAATNDLAVTEAAAVEVTDDYVAAAQAAAADAASTVVDTLSS